MLAGNRSLVKVFRRANDIWFFGRCDKTTVNRHKCIAIAPFKRQQTEPFAELHSNVVKDSGTQFSLLAAGAIKESIIDYEHVDTLFISKIFDVIIDDPWCQRRSKAEPISFWRIQETIKSVLWESLFERSGFLLHIHASSCEDVTEFISEERDSGNAFFFGAVAFL